MRFATPRFAISGFLHSLPQSVWALTRRDPRRERRNHNNSCAPPNANRHGRAPEHITAAGGGFPGQLPCRVLPVAEPPPQTPRVTPGASSAAREHSDAATAHQDAVELQRHQHQQQQRRPGSKRPVHSGFPHAILRGLRANTHPRVLQVGSTGRPGVLDIVGESCWRNRLGAILFGRNRCPPGGGVLEVCTEL